MMHSRVSRGLVLLCTLFLFLGCDTGLNQQDFRQVAANGVDDRFQSYPWAVEPFDGDGDGTPEIYVGTAPNALCIQAPGMIWLDEAIPDYQFLPPERWQCDNANFGVNWTQYVLNTLKPTHVYRGTYDEAAGAWNWVRAWDPPLSGADGIFGFRGARVFDGALYLTGNGTLSYVWKSTDGATFAKASPLGMGLYQGKTGFRGAVVFKDKLYISSDKGGMVFGSAAPSTSPASWSQVCSTGFVSSGGGTHYQTFDTGTATAAAGSTLSDATKTWTTNAYKGVQVKITAGTGEGQVRPVLSNTATTVTVGAAWDTVPDPTSAYEIFDPAAPDNENIWQLAAFNDQLYAITYNFVTGPELWRSPDPAPGNWTRVIYGGYGEPALQFMTVHAFGDHVYVGSCTYPPLFATPGIKIKGTEIFRVDADDNVELVVGEVRPAGLLGPEEVRPISGMGPGFNHLWNFYSWFTAEYDGWYYVGTCDFNGQFYDIIESSFGGAIPPEYAWLGDLLTMGNTGFDLWRTQDGVQWVKVSDDGFGEHDSYGVRNLMPTQWGLLLGAANAVDGFQIWFGKKE